MCDVKKGAEHKNPPPSTVTKTHNLWHIDDQLYAVKPTTNVLKTHNLWHIDDQLYAVKPTTNVFYYNRAYVCLGLVNCTILCIIKA